MLFPRESGIVLCSSSRSNCTASSIEAGEDLRIPAARDGFWSETNGGAIRRQKRQRSVQDSTEKRLGIKRVVVSEDACAIFTREKLVDRGATYGYFLAFLADHLDFLQCHVSVSPDQNVG